MKKEYTKECHWKIAYFLFISSISKFFGVFLGSLPTRLSQKGITDLIIVRKTRWFDRLETYLKDWGEKKLVGTNKKIPRTAGAIRWVLQLVNRLYQTYFIRVENDKYNHYGMTIDSRMTNPREWIHWFDRIRWEFCQSIERCEAGQAACKVKLYKQVMGKKERTQNRSQDVTQGETKTHRYNKTVPVDVIWRLQTGEFTFPMYQQQFSKKTGKLLAVQEKQM